MNKVPLHNKPLEDLSDAEYLRLTLSEINQSIAYLSHMVVELHKSVNAAKNAKAKPAVENPKEPSTIH